MSLESWKAEFYPVEASAVPADQAVAHSLRKWEGLTQANLLAHEVECDLYGVIDIKPLARHGRVPIDSQSCALCHRFYDESLSDSACSYCPLSKARDCACDERKAGEEQSPFGAWGHDQNPAPMIFWLKKAQS